MTAVNTPLGPLLDSAPPPLSEAEAGALARQHFGISGEISRLTSERDVNFRILSSDGSYVLKLANPAEARAVTRMQTAALLHLAAQAPDLPVPRVRRSLAGSPDVLLPDGTLLRCLTYLEGMPLHLRPRSPALGRAMGAIAARLTRGLAGFADPAADHVLQWDIRHASRLRPLLPAIADPGLRQLAEASLDRFDRQIAPRLAECRWQVVHNDLNPHNVLTDPADPDRIAGVLDFGDMVRTPLVCDLAVAASYQLVPEVALESLAGFTRAYEAVLPLSPIERALVPGLTETRMLTTVAITSWRAARYPENAAYILRNFASAREGLIALAAVPAAALTNAFGQE